MPAPIIHIGFHKTATTWFQRAVYPFVGNHVYIHRVKTHQAFLTHSALHFDPKRAREHLELPAGASPILCEEGLSGRALTGGHQGFQSIEIARRLKAVFPEGRIVAFVRSQPEMIASLYQQYVRVGGTRPPRRFLWPSDYSYADAKLSYPMPAFSFDHFDYDRLLSHYRSIFGAQRVHIYAYEEIRRDARAFLARFARDLGLDLEVERVALDKRNASYSLAVNRLGRLLNRFTAHNVSDKTYWVHVPYWYKVRKSLLEAANATGVLGERATPAQLLGPEVVAWIRQRYWESNRRLKELASLDLEAFDYPMDPPRQPVARPRPSRWASWMAH